MFAQGQIRWGMATRDQEPTELPPLYIRERMATPRVTGEQLAERMGTTPATVSRLLNGKRKMTLEWLYAFAKALNAPIESLLKPARSEQSTPEGALKSALLALGVDRSELDQVVRVVMTYVPGDGTPEQTTSEDRPQPASLRHVREPLE